MFKFDRQMILKTDQDIAVDPSNLVKVNARRQQRALGLDLGAKSQRHKRGQQVKFSHGHNGLILKL